MASLVSYTKSPNYSASYDIFGYSHIGYYEYRDQNGKTRWHNYRDVYVRNCFKVTYVGIIGSPQALLY